LKQHETLFYWCAYSLLQWLRITTRAAANWFSSSITLTGFFSLRCIHHWGTWTAVRLGACDWNCSHQHRMTSLAFLVSYHVSRRRILSGMLGFLPNFDAGQVHCWYWHKHNSAWTNKRGRRYRVYGDICAYLIESGLILETSQHVSLPVLQNLFLTYPYFFKVVCSKTSTEQKCHGTAGIVEEKNAL